MSRNLRQNTDQFRRRPQRKEELGRFRVCGKLPIGKCLMYLRKITVQYHLSGSLHPCPVKWLDNFAMRNFTNDPVFDDTLPVKDGVMEIGNRVPLERLRHDMEDWFRRKSYLTKDAPLIIEESPHSG